VVERPLGRTGLTVSALSLGTAALGADYGIGEAGAAARPPEHDAVALIRTAVDQGVTFIDTAPAYGDAERLVGLAVGGNPRVVIATKVTGEPHHEEAILGSIDASRRALGRDVIDVLQIHNATAALIEDGRVTRVLIEARRRGAVRVLGATVYGTDAARAVIRAGEFGVMQVALNILDQRMLREVMPRADAAGIGVVVRSAFLKGALTPRAAWLPDALAPLRAAATRVRDDLAGGAWDALPRVALRFCLSAPHVSSVLAGVSTRAELEEALSAEAAGPLDDGTRAHAAALAIESDDLLNPSRWKWTKGSALSVGNGRTKI
jgi:aryl-alcohol dehydrogenase-like predicted oxidoreductase